MAIRNVIFNDDPLLREKSKVVTEFDSRLFQLLDDMEKTMRYMNGCGLAAPQIGILKRICIVSPESGVLYEVINPTIKKASGRQVGVEGCLSIPNFSGRVMRPKKIVVEFQDRNGEFHTIEAEGQLATIFCHEIDHLDGILYIDKIIN